MKTIYFKFQGGQPNDAFNTPHGWLAVGDSGLHEGTRLLSCECQTVAELHAQANYLKQLIDEAIIDAERNLPSGTAA